jgi:hypothetical protein
MLLFMKSEGYYAVAKFGNPLMSVLPVEWIFKENAKLFCHWTYQVSMLYYWSCLISVGLSGQL